MYLLQNVYSTNFHLIMLTRAAATSLCSQCFNQSRINETVMIGGEWSVAVNKAAIILGQIVAVIMGRWPESRLVFLTRPGHLSPPDTLALPAQPVFQHCSPWPVSGSWDESNVGTGWTVMGGGQPTWVIFCVRQTNTRTGVTWVAGLSVSWPQWLGWHWDSDPARLWSQQWSVMAGRDSAPHSLSDTRDK